MTITKRGIPSGETTHQLPEQQSVLEESTGNRRYDSREENSTTSTGQEHISNRSVSTSNSSTNARGENTENYFGRRINYLQVKAHRFHLSHSAHSRSNVKQCFALWRSHRKEKEIVL